MSWLQDYIAATSFAIFGQTTWPAARRLRSLAGSPLSRWPSLHRKSIGDIGLVGCHVIAGDFRGVFTAHTPMPVLFDHCPCSNCAGLRHLSNPCQKQKRRMVYFGGTAGPILLQLHLCHRQCSDPPGFSGEIVPAGSQRPGTIGFMPWNFRALCRPLADVRRSLAGELGRKARYVGASTSVLCVAISFSFFPLVFSSCCRWEGGSPDDFPYRRLPSLLYRRFPNLQIAQRRTTSRFGNRQYSRFGNLRYNQADARKAIPKMARQPRIHLKTIYCSS